jgi:predicted MFS family arabinose efflux permease
VVAHFRRRTALGFTFFANGALFATWVSRIPSVRDRAGLSDAAMGLVLLLLGAASVVSLPLASLLVARWGSARVMRATLLTACLVLPLVGAARSVQVLAPSLAGLGASLGAMDLAMNAEASRLEIDLRRSNMSRLHALFSLGGLVGAGLGALFAAGGWLPVKHFPVVAASLAVFAFGVDPHASPAPSTQMPRVPSLAWPSRAVARIGLVAACASVVEGGLSDWGALFLRDAIGATASAAAAGYATFSVAMTVGRFGGDGLIDRWGAMALVRAGSLLAGSALALALWTRNESVTFAALALAGLGMATVFPIVFSVAGSLHGADEPHAIAAVATLGYGAGLVSPPAIGFAATWTSLPTALWVLVLACATLAAAAGRLGDRRPAAMTHRDLGRATKRRREEPGWN